MKLIIINEDEKHISGYEPVVLKDGKVDLSHVADNECSEILVNNSFTQLELKECAKFLALMFSKLRMGGTIKLNGVDPRMLSRSYIAGDIDDEFYNNIVYSCKSLISIVLLKSLIQRSGLKIETLSLSGINYDLTATR